MTVRRRRSDRSGRSKLHSPGRPDSARREELVRFWAAIATGRSSEDAARDAGVSPPVGSRWFRRSGGMPPSHLSQSAKPLSGRYLSFEEREEIALLRAQGRGIRHIACRLERAPSTISREVRRNAATRSGGLDYRATTAQWHADRSAKRPKPAKLATNEALRRYVQDRLAGRISTPDGTVIEGPRVVWNGRRHGPRQHRRWARAWSPEQIAHRLRIDYPGDGPEDQAMRISHEAIYQALYVQGRGALRRELTACLRTGRALRVPRARSRRRGKSFVTPEIMISERSAEAADRAVPGHWEGDLIIGLGRSAIGTLVERTTRFTMLRLWCMEPRWCDRPFPGWLADPDCVWFRRTDRAIECVDLHGDFGLLGLECASGEFAAVEPLDASHGCFAKRSQSVALSFLPVHPSLRRDLRRMVLPFRSAMRRVRGRNGCGAWRDDDFRW